VAGSLTAANALVVLIGAGLVALFLWAWAGRSFAARWWVGRPFGPRLVLAVIPGLGLLVLCGGVLALAGTAAAPFVAVPFLLGAVLELAGLLDVLPGLWAPAWYRRLPPGQRRADPARSSVAAAVEGSLGRPGVTSIGEAAARICGARPVGSWRGGWVHDPDSNERAHAMARRGTVEGRLTLYPAAVVFAATRAEDTLRGRTTVVLVETGEITGEEVVPARAGADGRPRQGRLYRSWFPRLVIRTGENAHVFEIARGRAREIARRLAPMAPEPR
jgi:hypothetical protein